MLICNMIGVIIRITLQCNKGREGKSGGIS